MFPSIVDLQILIRGNNASGLGDVAEMCFLTHRTPILCMSTSVGDHDHQGPVVAVAQLTATSDHAKNFADAATCASQAAAKGAVLLCLPEVPGCANASLFRGAGVETRRIICLVLNLPCRNLATQCFSFIGSSADETIAQSEPLDGPRVSQYRQLARWATAKLDLWATPHRPLRATRSDSAPRELTACSFLFVFCALFVGHLSATTGCGSPRGASTSACPLRSWPRSLGAPRAPRAPRAPKAPPRPRSTTRTCSSAPRATSRPCTERWGASFGALLFSFLFFVYSLFFFFLRPLGTVAS